MIMSNLVRVEDRLVEEINNITNVPRSAMLVPAFLEDSGRRTKHILWLVDKLVWRLCKLGRDVISCNWWNDLDL